MANVEVAVPVFPSHVVRVLRQAGAIAEIPIRANLIERVPIRISSDHAQAVIVARGHRDLQGVVVRSIDVPHLEDVAQVGELRREGPVRLFAPGTVRSAEGWVGIS